MCKSNSPVGRRFNSSRNHQLHSTSKPVGISEECLLFGSVKAYQGEWVEAVEQFSRTKTNDWLAIALLQAGRNDEYRRLRHECLERRGTALDTETRLNRAKAFLLLPADGEDSERACNLGDIDAGSVSVKRYVYWLDAVEALAEYRRGHFESASDLANRVISREDDTRTSRQAQAWCIRALACAQLQHMEQARVALASADELLNQPNRDVREDFLFSWTDWSIAEILSREAADALGIPQPQPSTDPKSTNNLPPTTEP